MIYENILTLIFVIFIYLIVFVLIPSYVLYPLVKEKPIGYRLFTYLMASHFYVLNIVYLLGFAHLFYLIPVIICVIILPVSYRTFRYREVVKLHFRQIREVYVGNHSLRLLLRRETAKIKAAIKKRYKSVFKKNLLEIALLVILLIAIILFYGYYKFHFNSYGVSDEEVHLYWVQSLIGGKFFISGMYPFAMHSMIVVVSKLSGINATMVSQLFSVIMLAQIVVCLYLLLRKFFKFKFGILFAIFFWLLTLFGGVVTYFRYQYTLPMEYGLIAVFAAVFFMISYIEDKNKVSLWMFGFSVSLTFSTHFYLTGFAVIICVCMGATYLWPILKKKILHWLLGMSVLGIVMAAMPFGVGYLLGYPFEQSIGWALGVMEDSKSSSSSDEPTPEVLSLTNPTDVYNGFSEVLIDFGELSKLGINFILISEGVLIILGIVGLIFSKSKGSFSFFLGMGISWIIILILSASSQFGISEFVEAKRAMEWVFILNTVLIAGLFEALYRILCVILKREDLSNVIMIYVVGGLLYFVFSINYIKNERVCATIQPEQIADFCNSVRKEYENETWTLVSPVNERSMILNTGYHYEWVDLLEELESWEENLAIYIPTKYVFFAIEKRPISYNSVVDVLEKDGLLGSDPVSPELANGEVDFDIADSKRSKLYETHRDIIMSKAYYWATEYETLFPHEMKVYYEDEEMIIYRLEQDAYALNNLSIYYGYN